MNNTKEMLIKHNLLVNTRLCIVAYQLIQKSCVASARVTVRSLLSLSLTKHTDHKRLLNGGNGSHLRGCCSPSTRRSCDRGDNRDGHDDHDGGGALAQGP